MMALLLTVSDAYAANPCPSNATPTLQNSDPACWTSRSVKTGTCSWYHTFTQIGCWCPKGTDYRRNLNEQCNKGCYNGSTFVNYADGCGGTHCTNNPQYPKTWGQTWDRYDTSYTCYYTIVDEWSTCNATTGIRYATSLEQKHTSGTSCDNLNEKRTQYCGVCTPSSNIDVTQMPTTTGICAHGTPTTPVLANDTWTWKCLGANNTIADDDASCSAENNVNGACISQTQQVYPWNATGFTGSLCAAGTPTINPQTSFPSYGQTVTWGCKGIGKGTSTAPNECSARRNCPEAQCGPAHSQTQTDTKPTTNLCATTPNHTASNVTLNTTTGAWNWSCALTNAYGTCTASTNCSAPSCLANNPLTVQTHVYWPTTGNPQASVRVNCQNVCCTFGDTPVNGTVNEKVCHGDTDKYIEITHAGSYPAQCYYTTDPDTKVTVNNTVQTMCVARSCNSQGTCQATPTPSASRDACTSTCSSDADCSTGRMIETRP